MRDILPKQLKFSARVAKLAVVSILFLVVLSSPLTAFAAEGYFWQTLPNSGTNTWADIATSADGSKVVAVQRLATDGTGFIYHSTDGGNTWTEDSSLGALNWRTVSMSDDGMVIVAAGCSTNLYVSEDGGATWDSRDEVRTWGQTAMSADGSVMLASSATVCGSGVVPLTGPSNPVYISTDTGATWTATAQTAAAAIAVSPDGSRLVTGLAATAASAPRISTDNGVSWTPASTTHAGGWASFEFASDNQTIYGVTGQTTTSGVIVKSTDGGVVFSEVLPSSSTSNSPSIATSADGQTVFSFGNRLSLNGGAGWTNPDSYPFPVDTVSTRTAMRGDGLRMYATYNNTLTAQQIAVLTYVYLPAAPSNLNVEYDSTSAKLSWTAPAYTGGSAPYDNPAILDYVIEYSTDDGVTWQVYDDGVLPSTGVTVAGLDPSLTYAFRVSAVNIAGQGEPVYNPPLAELLERRAEAVGAPDTGLPTESILIPTAAVVFGLGIVLSQTKSGRIIRQKLTRK